MGAHTLEVLEFYRVAELIAAYCTSEGSRTRCLQKRPLQNAADIAAAKTLGQDILCCLEAGMPLPLKNLPPLEPVVQQLHTAGGCLSIEEVYAAGLLALQINELTAWGIKRGREKNAACMFITAIPKLSVTEKVVFSCIDKTGALRDIPALTAIKKKIRLIEGDIEKTIRSYCTDEATKEMLQTPAPVLRNGRQVIVVRSNFKGRIKGIIHEYSQSHQSFYLEPESIVLKNNELMQAEAAYEKELHTILRNITAQLATEAENIARAYELVTELDCAAAAARWAHAEHGVFVCAQMHTTEHTCKYTVKSIQGTPAEEKPTQRDGCNAVYAQKDNGKSTAGSEYFFYLQQARHPLLRSQAVPIDLKLAAEDRILIITGPNTGGKTVAIKTAALCVLLNQTGWPILAGEHTHLPLFRSVGCAIGDEQSLDHSLSTFSAYMRTVGELIADADENSLILLDELGSGTDPQEGGALAMAILDELYKRKSLVFVTSHHGVLKNYAYQKKGCINASVAFDETTLLPSYRIVMGIPGESRAVDIAEKNGLSPAIITAARAYMADHSADAARLIKALIEKHQQLALFEKEKEAEEKALKEKQRRIDLQDLKLRQKAQLLREQGYKRLVDLFEQKRNEIENMVRTIQEEALMNAAACVHTTEQADRHAADALNHQAADALNHQAAGALNHHATGTLKRFFKDFEHVLADEKKAIEGENTELAAELFALQNSRQTHGNVEEVSSSTLIEGMEVFIPHLQRRGILVRKEKKNWLVAVDTIKMTFSADKLEPLAQDAALHTTIKLSTPQIIVEAELHRESRPVLELRLLGMHLAEAEKCLQDQLDRALMHNIQEFSIIHGKGSGVLQTMVQEKLASSPYIADFFFARPEHGGTGKTIVRLRQ